MKKIILFLIIILFSSFIFATIGTIGSFYGQTNPFNITFVGGENQSFYLDVPRYGYIENISLKLDGFTNETCYQETANETGTLNNGNSCGEINGTYYDYDIAETSYLEINYTKPITALPTSVIQYRLGGGSKANYSIPLDCWNAYNHTLTFLMYGGWALGSIRYSGLNCYNGSAWIDIAAVSTSCGGPGNNNPNSAVLGYDGDYTTGFGQCDNGQHACGSVTDCSAAIEEGMFWNMTTNYYPIDFILRIGNTIVYNNSIINTTTNVSLNITLINNALNNNCASNECEVVGNNARFNLTFYSERSGILQVNITNSTYEFGVDNCSDFTYPIINLTYKSATDNTIIQTDLSAYDLILTSPFSQSLQGTFKNQQDSSFCSRVNYTAYNYTFTGDITLQKPLYTTQIYEYTPSNYLIGYYPFSNYNLYMSKLTNTSTIVYTWRTNTFENVDGLMEIYECNGDGTKTLVSSVSIINGEAYGNIELINTPYSYEVIYDGSRYTDTDTYSKCHIETQSTRLYILDVGTPTAPITGIYSIPCNITKTGNLSALMGWGLNPQSDSLITGCISAYRQSVRGTTQIYQECSNTSGIALTVSDSGYNYIIKGHIYQNGYSIGCQNELTLKTASERGNTFGITGVLSVFFLIAGLVLLFANEKPKWFPIMGVVGMIVAWILGILAFGWVGISSLLAFVVIIVLIGRHGKKE